MPRRPQPAATRRAEERVVRVRVELDAEPMLPSARTQLRVFVLEELHRVLHTYLDRVEEVRVTARRSGGVAGPLWQVAVQVELGGGRRFEVRAEAPRAHSAADEVIYTIWQRLRLLHRGSLPRLRPRSAPSARATETM